MKKMILLLLLLCVLAPLGLLIPKYFNAGEAWGEWSAETIHEKTGNMPAGMKATASIYKAPLADYSLSGPKSSFHQECFSYIFSAVVGIAVLLLLTFGIRKGLKAGSSKQ